MSKTTFCNTGNDCADGRCQASRWWTSCDGKGSCRPSGDNTDAFKETVNANEGGSLTNACSPAGTSTCDSSKQCVGNALYGAHVCDGSGVCATPVSLIASCGTYACDKTLLQCKTQCATDADCVTPALFCAAPVCYADWEWARWNVTAYKQYTYTQDVVSDHQTGLSWQRSTADGGLTWAEAQSYCDQLPLGGYSDWRLPTRIELLSIVDPAYTAPAINGYAFPGSPSQSFWTSTREWGTGSPWCVRFDSGAAFGSNCGGTPWVRCVR